MKTTLKVFLVLVGLIVLFFAVPPSLSAQDTLMVLFGFLLLVVSVAGVLAGIWMLLHEVPEKNG